jgi:hypothetical protein
MNKDCPFCGAVVFKNDFGNASIEHKKTCYFNEIYAFQGIQILDLEKWNKRVIPSMYREITIKSVKSVRRISNAGLKESLNALKECDGDIDKAVELLKLTKVR